MVNGCEITKKQGAYVTKNEPLKSHGLRGCLYHIVNQYFCFVRTKTK